MSEALVTLFVPSFNHAAYVEDCLESIVQQTHSDIELLIVDDGSADNSGAIIENLIPKLKSRFCRLEFVKQKNRGLTPTLNQALKWSEGKFFMTLASDDKILPTKITAMINYFDNNAIAAVAGGIEVIDEKSVHERNLVPKIGIWSFEDVLLRKVSLYAPSAMFRTSALREVGGYWEDIQIEDRAMWLKLTHVGYKVQTVDEVVASYRRHKTNATLKYVHEMVLSRMKIYDKFEPHPLIAKVRSRDLLGAAKDLALVKRRLALSLLLEAIKIRPTSLFSNSVLKILARLVKFWV